MKIYSNIISLSENGRGVYCIDTIAGCNIGMTANKGGCYNDCYAAKTAKRYSYDFSKSVLRKFTGDAHESETIKQINKIKMPFIRIGCSGDPSENWQHTLSILSVLKRANIEIVIITRHWNLLSDEQLCSLTGINICINTSISALDNEEMRERSLQQYERIKPYCKSVLRIVSCNFNLENDTGFIMNEVQKELFKNESTLDTVFRSSSTNEFVLNGIIKVKKEIFNGKAQLASKFNRKTYMGKCSACKEMCGVNISSSNIYDTKRIFKQNNLF